MRFRDEKPEDLTRARDEVSAWRKTHPEGTPEQLTAAVGRHFHPDWAPVLRALLFVTDKHNARQATGIITGPASPAVSSRDPARRSRAGQRAAQTAPGGCRE